MSFRRKNVLLSSPSSAGNEPQNCQSYPRGVRASPLDGRPTLSTGTESLDKVVAGAHGGLPLGSSLMVEESGTTDFAGILSRYYAAEGLVQGHHVHALALDESWATHLPGLARREQTRSPAGASPGAMKIAWRYETLASRGGSTKDGKGIPSASQDGADAIFCHNFDLSKRLNSRDITGRLHAYPSHQASRFRAQLQGRATTSLLGTFTQSVVKSLKTTDSSTVHRVVVSSFLSPSLYEPNSDHPGVALAFLHSLRALLRLYPARLSVLVTLPTALHPRDSGLTRWMELICDGVMELRALPWTRPSAGEGASPNDVVQGFLTIHSLPVYQDRGSATKETKASFDNLVFRLSSSSGIVVSPYSLPPIGDDSGVPESQSKNTKNTLDF